MVRTPARLAWLCTTLLGAATLHAQIQETTPAPAPSSPWRFEEIRRAPAAEARQGVAVDDTHFYAIDNRAIGKYRLDTGARVAGWKGEKDGPLTHLNAGIVRDGRLYCAHSNFPATPTVSSVEIWDTATMQHVGSHSFGHFVGSLTWVDHKDGFWYACFAQYAKAGSDAGKDPSFTELIKFDEQWRRLEGWIFPPSLVKRFAGNSSSGGGFGPEAGLFISGHDAKELYQITFPDAGSVLNWTGMIPVTFAGQAFAWHGAGKDQVLAIDRSKKEVVIGRVVR